MMNEKNLIQDRTLDFALMIIEVYKKMSEKNEYVSFKQLVRSGTSIGANIEETLAAFTKKDLVHKMSFN